MKATSKTKANAGNNAKRESAPTKTRTVKAAVKSASPSKSKTGKQGRSKMKAATGEPTETTVVESGKTKRMAATPVAAPVAKAKKSAATISDPKGSKNDAPVAKQKVHNRLTSSQLKDLRSLLLTMRERLDSSISTIKSESLATSDWINTEEDGTDVFDQQFALNIVSSENEMLIQIDEALSRIESKAYGLCEDCGCPIHAERLKALPFAKSCIECQSRKEGSQSNRQRFLDVLE